MHAVADTLRLTNLFDSLSDSEFAAVVEGSIKVRGRPGEVIVKEGDRGDELFVILDGSVQVYTQTRMGSEIVLAKLEAGQFFGEQALLPGTSDLRNASVRAFSDATLVKISHDAFQQALSRRVDRTQITPRAAAGMVVNQNCTQSGETPMASVIRMGTQKRPQRDEATKP